jgi:hypothetical protein
MQFKSQAVPADDAGTIFKATTTAPSCTMTTVVGANGFSANSAYASRKSLSSARRLSKKGTI